jgi:hypothetical protein
VFCRAFAGYYSPGLMVRKAPRRAWDFSQHLSSAGVSLAGVFPAWAA